MRVASRDREWKTETGKANFIVHSIQRDTPIQSAKLQHGSRLMTHMTTRSHDQYNTTVYALDDCYRGVFGQRRVVFVNPDDIALLGFKSGDWVDITTIGAMTSCAAQITFVSFPMTSRAAASQPTTLRPIHLYRYRVLETFATHRPPNRFPHYYMRQASQPSRPHIELSADVALPFIHPVHRLILRSSVGPQSGR